MPTYRTAGAWGSGAADDLDADVIDANFYELRTAIDDLIANPPTADSVVSVSQSGFDLTFHTTLGNALGPLTMPVVQFRWRGEWSPLTLYEAADTFIVTGTGLFTVMADHTSAATFDPDATGGSPAEALYNQLFGVGTNTTLDDLSDVSAGSPIAGQVLRYIGGSPDALWQPDTLVLDDLGDVSAAAPADGDVLTYQAGSPTGWIASAPAAVPSTLDSLTDVSVPSPADGDFLRYEAGSPAGWINEAGTAVSGLGDATLPLVAASYLEISEPAGSPAVYTSKKITAADLLDIDNLTGLGSGVATFLATPSSANLASAVTGETGSGALVFGTSPTIAAPVFSGTVTGTYTLGGTPTLSGGTLSGTTTLPGSGQISTAGFVGIGGAADANKRLSITGSVGAGVGRAFLSLNNADTSTGQQVYAELTANDILGQLMVSGSGYSAIAGWGSGIALRTAATSGHVDLIADGASGFLRFITGGPTNERARLISDGKFGIGSFTTVNPQALLHIGTSAATVRSYNSFTDAANGEWAYLGSWGPTANVATFGPDKNGTGTYRVGRWVSGGKTIWESLVNGDFRIGTGAAIATTATGGFPKIPTCAGTPTGVPGNAATGSAEVVYDSTGKKLWIYDNATTSWKGAVFA